MIPVCVGMCQETKHAIQPADTAGQLLSTISFAWQYPSEPSTLTTNSPVGKIINLPETWNLVTHILCKIISSPNSEPNTHGSLQLSNQLSQALNIVSRSTGYAQLSFQKHCLASVVLGVQTKTNLEQSQLDNLLRVCQTIATRVKPDSEKVHATVAYSTFSNGWVVFAIAQDPQKLIQSHTTQIQQGRSFLTRALPGKTNWVTTEITGSIAKQLIGYLLPHTISSNPTNILVRITLEKDFVRTFCQISYSNSLPNDRSTWNPPTNLVEEPLVGFLAAKGIKPLLTNLSSVIGLPPNQIPDQLFYWTTDGLLCQGYLAWPSPNPKEDLQTLHTQTFEKYRAKLWNSLETEVVFTNDILFWDGLPFLRPFARYATNSHGNFVVVGLAYVEGKRKKVPPALFAQFSSNPRIFIYSWEYTPAVLFQARNITQLARLLMGIEQIPAESPWWKWVDTAMPYLGETVTSAQYTATRTITILRRSNCLLSGWEIVALANLSEGCKPELRTKSRTTSRLNHAPDYNKK